MAQEKGKLLLQFRRKNPMVQTPTDANKLYVYNKLIITVKPIQIILQKNIAVEIPNTIFKSTNYKSIPKPWKNIYYLYLLLQ